MRGARAMRGTGMDRYSIPSLVRACRVLKMFAGSEEVLSSSEVARRLRIPRTTAMRILLTLAGEGLLTRQGADFRSGPEILRLGLRALGSLQVKDLAGPALLELSRATGETAHLAIPTGTRTLILEVSESPHPVRAASRPGTVHELHCTATGKVFLAHLVYPDLAAFAATAGLEPRTPQTLTTLAELKAECEAVRRQGYAVDNEEYYPGVRCLAAPVRDAGGRVVAAVGVTASIVTFTRRRIPELAGHVLGAAEALSRSLGYLPAEGPVRRQHPATTKRAPLRA